MAKSKVKRYAFGDAVYEDDTPEEVANRSEESQAIANEAKGEGMLKAMRDEAAAAKPKAVSKPKTSTASTTTTKATTTTPSAPSTSSASSTTSTPSSTKKETYRTLSGEIKTKKSGVERDAEMAARRESAMSGLRSIGSSISDMFSKAKQNYESTRPVSRQVQRERDQAAARGNLAKGGMTASKRADGIAQRGKTKGTIVMCGGGMYK